MLASRARAVEDHPDEPKTHLDEADLRPPIRRIPKPRPIKLEDAAQSERGRTRDAHLLELVLAGDERAWAVFFRRFRPLIASCAVRTSHQTGIWLNAEELNDLVSEVSINMLARDHRRLRLYRPEAGTSLSTWVGLIATSTTRDYLRRKRRDRSTSSSYEELDEICSSYPGPEEILVDRESRALVDATLSGLSARDQEFVEMYFSEAKTPQEIADQMGISVATVYSKKAKIRSRLIHLTRGQIDGVGGVE